MTAMQQALYAAMSHKTLMLLDTGKAKVALGTYTCLNQCTHANQRVKTSEWLALEINCGQEPCP